MAPAQADDTTATRADHGGSSSDLDRPDYAGRADRTSAKSGRGNARLDDPGAQRSPKTIESGDDGADRDDRGFADRLGLRKSVRKNQNAIDAGGTDAPKRDGSASVDALSADDSNYGRHSFIDLLIGDDFGSASMNDLRDALKDQHSSDLYSDDFGSRNSDKIGDSRLYPEKKNFVDKEKEREKIERRKDLNYDEVLELYAPPPPVGPNGWVPDKLDPIQTGAFGTAPDNGSPVPYRLNGHVDIERGAPWEHHD